MKPQKETKIPVGFIALDHLQDSQLWQHSDKYLLKTNSMNESQSLNNRIIPSDLLTFDVFSWSFCQPLWL